MVNGYSNKKPLRISERFFVHVLLYQLEAQREVLCRFSWRRISLSIAVRGAAFPQHQYHGQPWHSIYHRALLILPNGISTSLAHVQQALGTVGAHTGEDHTDGLAARCFRYRVKQYIDRRAVAVYLGSCNAGDKVARASRASRKWNPPAPMRIWPGTTRHREQPL